MRAAALPSRLVVRGLSAWRDCVLALPRLARLRSEHPDAQITVLAPPQGRDLLLRLRLASDVYLTAGRSVFSVLAWIWRQRVVLRARIVQARDLPAASYAHGMGDVKWALLARDMSSLIPARDFVALILPARWPELRVAALVRKLDLRGYAVLLLAAADDHARQRVCAAAPALIDYAGRIDAADIPQLAMAARVVIGGLDGETTLAALCGARTVMISATADVAGQAVLPTATTRWLYCEDLTQLGIGDVMEAIDDWI